jgi:hypothetical protein
MTVEPDNGVEDLLEKRCEVCGATLTADEIEVARENGGPFLCTVHGMEELPAEEQADELDEPAA